MCVCVCQWVFRGVGLITVISLQVCGVVCVCVCVCVRVCVCVSVGI